MTSGVGAGSGDPASQTDDAETDSEESGPATSQPQADVATTPQVVTEPAPKLPKRRKLPPLKSAVVARIAGSRNRKPKK